VQYVEHRLQDGNLEAVIDEIVEDPEELRNNSCETALAHVNQPRKATDTSLMVMVSRLEFLPRLIMC
jgi:hypothetical protein